MLFLDTVIRRAINYVLVPFVAKSINFCESTWQNLDPHTRKTIYRTVTYVFWPFFTGLDYLRFALIRAYVVDPKCASTILSNLGSVNAILFGTKPVAPQRWTGQQQTRAWVFPVVVVLSPLFYAVDIARSVAVDFISTEQNVRVDGLLESVWQNMFGSTTAQSIKD